MKAVTGAILAMLAFALVPTARADTPPPDYAAIIAAPDRTDADRKNDARREAVKLLAFTGVLPGWKVIDMAAGAGYSTELMARGAAPGGTVYAQNPPDLRPNAGKADFAERMKRSGAMKDVVSGTSGPSTTLRAAGREQSRSHHLLLRLSRHDLYPGGPGQDESRHVRCAEAGRLSRRRRLCCLAPAPPSPPARPSTAWMKTSRSGRSRPRASSSSMNEGMFLRNSEGSA